MNIEIFDRLDLNKDIVQKKCDCLKEKMPWKMLMKIIHIHLKNLDPGYHESGAEKIRG